MKLVRHNALKLASIGILLASMFARANTDATVTETPDNYDCIVKGITECSIPSSIEDFAKCVEKVFAACSGQ